MTKIPDISYHEITPNAQIINRGRLRRIARVKEESVLIVFDLIWIVSLSDRNFATHLDPPRGTSQYANHWRGGEDFLPSVGFF